MLPYLIPLFSSFITDSVLQAIFYPLFFIYFVAAVPSIFRSLAKWR